MSKCILFFLLVTYFHGYKNMILRGKRARDGQFPWLMQFQTIAPCGGVLLSPDWVLTAAQCVQDKRNSIALFASGLNGTGSTQVVYVKATYIFPLYQAYSEQHDRDHNIALLKLNEPFRVCNTEVILPEIAPITFDDNYKSCLIFGWQSYVSLSTKVFAKPIQYSEVMLNPWKLCTYMIKGNASYKNVFCTMVEFKEEMKACAGNPGSPVVCTNQQQKIILLGIASWTNFSLDCGELPTYLDVHGFRAWIDDLTLNDKIVEEDNTDNKSSKRLFISKGIIDLKQHPWNYTNLLQRNSERNYVLEDTVSKTSTLPHLVIPHQNFQKDVTKNSSTHSSNKLVPPGFDTNDYSKVPVSHDYYDAPYVDIIKGRNNVQQFEEIGKIKESQNCNNEIMASSNRHEKRINKLDNLLTQYDDQSDNADDLEFLISFSLEDTVMSYSNVIVSPSKNLILFYTVVLYLF